MSDDDFDPDEDRIRVMRHNGDMTVTIKALSHIYITLFMCMWIVIWAPALYITIIALESGIGVIFVALFLLFWLAIGVALGCFILWNFMGREVIQIKNNTMTICRKIPGWSRKREYQLNRIRKLQVDDSLERQLYTNQVPPPNIYSGWSQGTIKFEYGDKTIGFGMEVEKSEALQLSRIIRKSYSQIGSNSS